MQPMQPMPSGPPTRSANPNGAQRKTTIVLTILVVVLVAATGLFLTLFLVERGATAEARNQTSVTERQIAGERDQVANATSAVADLEKEGQTLGSDNTRMQTCVDASKKSIQAALTGTEAELDQAIDQVLVDCARSGVSGG